MFKKFLLTALIGISIIFNADGRSGSFSSGGFSSSTSSYSPSYSGSSSYSPSYSSSSSYSPSYSSSSSSSYDSGSSWSWGSSSSSSDTTRHHYHHEYKPYIPKTYAELAGISVSSIDDYLNSEDENIKAERKETDQAIANFLKQKNELKLTAHSFENDQQDFINRVKSFENNHTLKIVLTFMGIFGALLIIPAIFMILF